MKKLPTPKNAKLPLLTEELFEAFPHWRYKRTSLRNFTRPEENFYTNVLITDFEIVFPDDTSEEEVQVVLQKHDHTKPSKNEKAKMDHQLLLEEIEKAQSVDDLKKILRSVLKDDK